MTKSYRVTPRTRPRTSTAPRRRRHEASRNVTRAIRHALAVRNRLKVARSVTRTTTAKKQRTITSAQAHYSMSSCNYGGKPRRLLTKTSVQQPRNTIVQNYGGILTEVAGRQAVSGPDVMLKLFDIDDLNNIVTQIQDLQGSLIKNTSQLFQTSYIIEKGHAELTMKNDTNDMNVVYLYDCICRRDTTREDPSNLRMFPDVMWELGDLYAGRDGTTDQLSTTNYKAIGAVPFESKSFTSFFKVAKVTKIIMDPGSIHVHHVKWAPNKLWNNAIESNNAVGFKGLSVYTMIVAYGAPALAATGGFQGATTTPVKIVTNLKKNYTYQPVIQPYMRATFLEPGLPATAGQLIDPETGVKEAFTQA